MRIGVFSDLHGNQYALRSFMRVLPSLNVDVLIFCGDIFGYYYGQCEIIDTLSGIPMLHWLLGNHDKNYLDMIDGKVDAESLMRKYGNSYQCVRSVRLPAEPLLEKLPQTLSLNLANTKIFAVHGTPQDPLNGRLYPNDVLPAEVLQSDVLIMGHTHFRLAKRNSRTLYLNPGSLGQPRDKFPAGIAILTLPACSVEFVDIPYDRTALEIEIYRNDPGNRKLIEILHRADRYGNNSCHGNQRRCRKQHTQMP